MKISEQILRLSRIVDLIKRKATGCPKDLAHRLEVSERTVYNLVDSLRDLGVPVHYDEEKRTYRFPDGVQVDLKLIVKEEEQHEIKGGANLFFNFFSHCNFLSVETKTFEPVTLQ